MTPHRVIELHRIVGQCRPIIVTIYLIDRDTRRRLFTVNLNTEEFYEHVYQHIVAGGTDTDMMFERLSQLHKLRVLAADETSKKLINTAFAVPEEKDETTT